MIKNFLQLRLNAGLWNEVMHHNSVLNQAQHRTFVVGCSIAFLYVLIAVRLTDIMALNASPKARDITHSTFDPIHHKRRDIVDRNEEVVATQIVTASVYAEPKHVISPQEAAKKLSTILPHISHKTLLHRLQQKNKAFVWLARHIPPKAQERLYQLGIPGVHLQRDYRRVYPHGDLCAHVLGGCNIDGQGHSGIELSCNELLSDSKTEQPLKLSIDTRVQHMVSDILASAIEEFDAIGGNVIVMHIPDGQILAMVSLPSYDPNQPTQSVNMFNRNTMGVYEPGSTFKVLNTAIALESGKIPAHTLFDARHPIKIGNCTVTDFSKTCSFLTLEQAFIKSSNIASILIMRMFGPQIQFNYFKRFGVFDPLDLELPERRTPLYPSRWTDVTAWTASYGYGIAITPIRAVNIVASLINDGRIIRPTLLYSDDHNQPSKPTQHKEEPLVSKQTSARLRELMRTAAIGRKADIPGLDVMGKSGTTYKRVGAYGYGSGPGLKPRITTFIGAFPQYKPQYVLYIALDEPKARAYTRGYAAAGWNATPTAGKILQRIAGLLVVDKDASTA